MTRRTGHKLRLPVRVVDGLIEFEFGGRLPLREDAYAELTVDQSAIEDEAFMERMTRRRRFKMLPEGERLYVMLSFPSAGSQFTQAPDLGKWFDDRRFPANYSYVPITIGPVPEGKLNPEDGKEGGLWLETQGNRSLGLIASSLLLPKEIRKEPVKSLNHAYTILSERLEKHRISHTGNVYEQVLYQEANRLWYPLKLFRSGKIANEEHHIAKAFWAALREKMRATV